MLCPDGPDSSSEDFNYEPEPEQCEYIDATTSIRDFDLEAPPSEQDHSLISSSPTDSEPSNSPEKALNPDLQHASAGSTAAPSAGSGAGSRTLQALLSWRHRGGQHGLKEPLLVAIDESPVQSKNGQEAGPNSSYEVDSGGDTVRDSSVWTQTDTTIACEPQGSPDADADDADASGSQRQQQPQPQQQRHAKVQPRSSAGGAASDLPPPAFAHLEPTTSSPAGLHTTHAGPRTSPASRGFMAHGRRSFTEGVKLTVPTYSSRGSHTTSPTPPDRADGAGQGWSPRAASESGYCFNCAGTNSLHLPRVMLPPAAAAVGALSSVGSVTPTRRCTSDGSWLQGDPLGSGALSPHLQQLHEQHFAEQVELLEQQAAEHDALLAEHEEQQEELKAGGVSTKHKLQYPFVQLLSCTMPRVSRHDCFLHGCLSPPCSSSPVVNKGLKLCDEGLLCNLGVIPVSECWHEIPPLLFLTGVISHTSVFCASAVTCCFVSAGWHWQWPSLPALACLSAAPDSAPLVVCGCPIHAVGCGVAWARPGGCVCCCGQLHHLGNLPNQCSAPHSPQRWVVLWSEERARATVSGRGTKCMM